MLGVASGDFDVTTEGSTTGIRIDAFGSRMIRLSETDFYDLWDAMNRFREMYETRNMRQINPQQEKMIHGQETRQDQTQRL